MREKKCPVFPFLVYCSSGRVLPVPDRDPGGRPHEQLLPRGERADLRPVRGLPGRLLLGPHRRGRPEDRGRPRVPGHPLRVRPQEHQELGRATV